MRYEWMCRELCINRFQIQMEAKGQSQKQTAFPENPEQEALALSPDYCEEDSFSIIIQELIDRKQPIFVVTQHRVSPENQQLQQEIIKQKILSYNRKEKSLEELSRKFIDNFQGRGEVLLELDKVTQQLRVERRRIYDIVNIFESLHVVRKVAKNNYVWRGLTQAVKTIAAILESQDPSLLCPAKKEKSLQNLAARFLKLFIFEQQAMSLEEAARLLIQTENSALVKTKIRRLYDIVNVFKSVGLVQKAPLSNKKPGFKWMGTGCLQKIISEQRRKCLGQREERTVGQGQKQNEKGLENSGNVNDWFSQQQRQVFMSLGLMKQFSQKVFFPSIIQKDVGRLALGGTQQSLNDICSQY